MLINENNRVRTNTWLKIADLSSTRSVFHWPILSKSVSCSVISDSETPWTVACQAPLSMEFSRQEYWSGLPFPTPGDLPDPVMEPASLMSPSAWQVGSLPLAPPGKLLITH